MGSSWPECYCSVYQDVWVCRDNDISRGGRRGPPRRRLNTTDILFDLTDLEEDEQEDGDSVGGIVRRWLLDSSEEFKERR